MPMSVPTHTLLIVEDDDAIRDMLTLSLQREGYHLLQADCSQVAWQQLQQNSVDLILLDWMLPTHDGNESGVEFTLRIKQQPKLQHIPIIMLTAKSQEEDKLTGFNIGVDDYLSKPFSVRELSARIKSVLRRSQIQPSHETELPTPSEINQPVSEIISLNGIHLDQARHLVYTTDKQEIRLGPTEFKLLAYLMQHAGRVFSRETLLNRIWGETVYVEERTVDVHIRRLRRAFEPFALEHLIRTVRGSGYSFRDQLDVPQ